MKSELLQIIKKIHQEKTDIKLNIKDINYFLYSSRNSDLLFVFIKHNAKPEYVIKISSEERIKNFISNEYEKLNKIINIESDILSGTVSSPLYLGAVNSHSVMVETAVKGDELNEYICKSKSSQRKTRKIFQTVTGWLTELHQKVYPEKVSVEELLGSKAVSEPVRLYKDAHILTEKEEDKINTIIDEMRNLQEREIPVVMQHGDFSPWNILYDRKTKKIKVFDWEYSIIKGLPLVDLLNFFIVYQSVIRANRRANKNRINFKSFSANINNPLPDLCDFEEIFYNENSISALVKEYIDVYCEKMGIEKNTARFLFLIFILKHLFLKKDFVDILFEKGDPLFLRG